MGMFSPLHWSTVHDLVLGQRLALIPGCRAARAPVCSRRRISISMCFSFIRTCEPREHIRQKGVSIKAQGITRSAWADALLPSTRFPIQMPS